MADKTNPIKLLQYQKPMAVVLTALALPALFGVYNFGWRVLAVVVVANLAAFAGEWFFVRKEGKPVTLSALVTGTLLALSLPVTIPFWMAAVGALFGIVFGKMAFGGFGKNIFNPAIVGRCFVYIAFPLAAAGAWSGPVEGTFGGFAKWISDAPVKDVRPPLSPGFKWIVTSEEDKARDEEAKRSFAKTDSVSGATTLAAAKKLNTLAKEETENKILAAAGVSGAETVFAHIDIWPLFWGSISGSAGETSALAILLGFIYMLYRKSVIWQLAAGPLIGMALGALVLWLGGVTVLPPLKMFAVSLFAGGAFFAIAFMTTEPISAPQDKRARWVYGILIGFLASTIRAMSVFSEGFMFAILLGNTFGPAIEAAFAAWDERKASRKSGGASA